MTLIIALGLVGLVFYLMRLSAFLYINLDLKDNENYKIEINNCAVNIFDYGDSSIFTPFVNIPSESTSSGIFRMIIPGPLAGSNTTLD